MVDATEPAEQLRVGDRVVYPNQGLCTIAEIKTEEIAGQRLNFVSLVFAETGAKVKVPEAKLTKNGVRALSSKADVKLVFDFLKSDSEKASLDWKKRKGDNTARLSEGALLGLAEVVKGLQVLSELRPLPPKEREQYNDARHLMVEELAAALDIEPADAEDAFDLILFPVGKERPKRSIDEFKALAGDDDFDDLLGISTAVDEPSDDEADASESDEKPEVVAEGKAKSTAKTKTSVKSTRNDEAEAPAPKKRGRPAKAKVETKEAAAPKKRGRPPKPKSETPEDPPKKRGRPPKAKA